MFRHTVNLILFILAFSVASVLSAAVPQEIGSPLEDRVSIEAEYDLAKEPHCYFNLTLSSKELELKVKGTVLKKWAIRTTKFWGKPAFPANVELVRKSALLNPKRFRIRPGTGEEEMTEADPAVYELDALEVVDMPRNYTFLFDNGFIISVRTKAKGITKRIGSLIGFFRWYGLIPSRNLFRTIVGKPMTVLELTFNEERDAQSLYWILYEGIKGRIQ